MIIINVSRENRVDGIDGGGGGGFGTLAESINRPITHTHLDFSPLFRK